jgi:nitrous oxidase accessory protein NosD
MRKSVSVLLILAFLTASSIVTPLSVKAEPKTIVVPDDYPTIQAAVDNASARDTVFVKAGIYSSPYDQRIIIDKSLSLIGENPQNTIIDGINKSKYLIGHTSYFWGGINIYASAVTVSGFTIKNCNYAISLDESEAGYRPVSGVRIVNNNIVNNSEAIVHVSYYDSDFFISGNNITNNDNGIRFEVSNSIVSNNNILENGEYGIDIGYNAVNVTVRYNNISGNEWGGLMISAVRLLNVYGNNINYNDGFGIGFYGAHNVSVHNNNIVGNSIGIELSNDNPGDLIPRLGSENNVYYNNIRDNAQNALVHHSYRYNVTVQNNGTDAVSWDNGFVGNYWSDYNGLGAYVIDENNVDRHPLTHQVDISTTAPELSTIILTIAVIVVAIGVGAGLLFYFKKRKH